MLLRHVHFSTGPVFECSLSIALMLVTQMLALRSLGFPGDSSRFFAGLVIVELQPFQEPKPRTIPPGLQGLRLNTSRTRNESDHFYTQPFESVTIVLLVEEC
jgi:hypothetical protein